MFTDRAFSGHVPPLSTSVHLSVGLLFSNSSLSEPTASGNLRRQLPSSTSLDSPPELLGPSPNAKSSGCYGNIPGKTLSHSPNYIGDYQFSRVSLRRLRCPPLDNGQKQEHKRLQFNHETSPLPLESTDPDDFWSRQLLYIAKGLYQPQRPHRTIAPFSFSLLAHLLNRSNVYNIWHDE